jgi:prostatic aicd phosphatase
LTVLKLENCDEICLLSDYLKIIDPILPLKYGTECLYENAKNEAENIINGIMENTEDTFILPYI